MTGNSGWRGICKGEVERSSSDRGHTHSHDWAEDLLGHRDGLGVLGDDDGGLDEPTLGLVT